MPKPRGCGQQAGAVSFNTSRHRKRGREEKKEGLRRGKEKERRKVGGKEEDPR